MDRGTMSAGLRIDNDRKATEQRFGNQGGSATKPRASPIRLGLRLKCCARNATPQDTGGLKRAIGRSRTTRLAVCKDGGHMIVGTHLLVPATRTRSGGASGGD